MSIPRQKFREIVFQILYSYDFSGEIDEEKFPFMMEEMAVSKKNLYLAKVQVEKILEKLSELDRLITSSSQSYKFDRISRVEKNILRLGVYEVLFDDQTPGKVAISEAIRIARKYATKEGATFVNAILDHIYKSEFPEESVTN